MSSFLQKSSKAKQAEKTPKNPANYDPAYEQHKKDRLRRQTQNRSDESVEQKAGGSANEIPPTAVEATRFSDRAFGEPDGFVEFEIEELATGVGSEGGQFVM